LFACSVRPLYFGRQSEGTILGYVISGFAIDRPAVEQLSRITGVDATFISGDDILASSMKPGLEKQIAAVKTPPSAAGTESFAVVLGGESYLAVVRTL
jgi:hypothetical protein